MAKINGVTVPEQIIQLGLKTGAIKQVAPTSALNNLKQQSQAYKDYVAQNADKLQGTTAVNGNYTFNNSSASSSASSQATSSMSVADQINALIAKGDYDTATQLANALVASNGGGVITSGGGSSSGSSVSRPTYNYQMSDYVLGLKDKALNYGAWTGGTYGQDLKDALSRINNREAFKYDLNGDALYQQYKDQYINLGQQAMMDTMGQAATMTGGYGNSYANTAGNQAYQGYLQQLNNKVPELYQLALDSYSRQGDELYRNASMLGDMYNTEYNQWNADRAYNTDLYMNEAQNEFNRYNSAYNAGADAYSQSVAEQQWNKEFTEKQKQNQLATDQYNEQMAYEREQAAQAQKNWQAEYDAKQKAAEQEQKNWEAEMALSQLKASSGGSGSSNQNYSMTDYNRVSETAESLAGNPDALYSYVMNAYNSGWISYESAKEIYARYAMKSSSTAVTNIPGSVARAQESGLYGNTKTTDQAVNEALQKLVNMYK